MGSLRLQENCSKNAESSQIAPAPTHAEPPPLSTSHNKVVHLLQFVNLQWHIKITQTLYFISRFTLWLHIYEFEKMWNEIYPPLQYHKYFYVLKALCALSNHHPLLYPKPLTTTDLLIVSIVWTFPENYIVGIIHYVGFSDGSFVRCIPSLVRCLFRSFTHLTGWLLFCCQFFRVLCIFWIRVHHIYHLQ